MTSLATLSRSKMAQRATQAARSAAQLAGARLVPAATTSWRRFLERNKQYVQQEEPRVLAKQLLFTSLTRCVAHARCTDARTASRCA